MNRRLVVFFGNCQARALWRLYRERIAPLREERVLFVDKLQPAKHVLREADVLFEQVFNSSDGDLSGELQDSTVHIKFPHVSAMFLWPFSGGGHPRNAEDVSNPAILGGPYPDETADRFLNTLLARNMAPEEAIQAYYDLDIVSRCKLGRLFEVHLEHQCARDTAAGIPIAHIIETHFRTERLFTTRGHPTARLFQEVAMAALPRADVSPEIVQHAISTLESSLYPHNEAPLHPGVIEHFGLKYASDTTCYKYGVLGRLSRDEWWRRYLTYDWNRNLYEGLLASRRGKTALALTLVNKGLLDSPNSAVGWRCKCRLLLQLNRLDEAQDAARQARQLDEELPEGAVEAVQVLLRQNRVEEAEVTAREALTKCPVYQAAHLALTTVLTTQGRFHEAIQVLEGLLRFAPGNVAAQQRLANILVRVGSHDQASIVLRKALFAHPTDAAILKSLTNILTSTGQPEEAVAVARESFQRNAANARLAAVLASALLTIREAEEAEKILRDVLQKTKEPAGLHGLLAESLVQQGNLEEALVEALLEVRESEHDESSHVRLVKLHLRCGGFAQAEAAAKTGLITLPASRQLKRLLGTSLAHQKHYAEALSVFEELAEHGSVDSHLYSKIGSLKFELQDFDGAEVAYRKALTLPPVLSSLADSIEQLQRARAVATAMVP